MASLKISLLFTLSLLLITTPQPSLSFPFQSLPFSSYQTLFSLAQSLASHVANLRAARGDLDGAWMDVRSVSAAWGLVSDLNELMSVVNELTSVDSNVDRAMSPQPSLSCPFQSLPFSSYQTLFSLAHSLASRAARGDLDGAWRDVRSVSAAWGLVSDLNELMSVVNELTSVDSNVDRAMSPQPSLSFPFQSLPFSSYQTLFSLAHSLASRVANLRAARGDLDGAARARSFAQKIRPGIGLSFWRFMLSAGWDCVRNYSWRDVGSVSAAWGLVSDLNELMSVVNELTRFDSSVDGATWVQRNYKNVLRVTKSMFGRLNKLFYQQGPLREVVQMLQKEVVEGELLRDCLELGSGDLKALIQIMKDIVLQYSSKSRNNEL